MNDPLFLPPITSANLSLNLSGSKSLSNRALLLASLAKGTTSITNLLECDDTYWMMEALKKLGVQLSFDKKKKICVVQGQTYRTSFSEPIELFLGNAGTAYRPLTAFLSTCSGTFYLQCEPRMEERPIADLVEPLRALGAKISYMKTEGYPPLKIEGRPLNGGDIQVSGQLSSQFISSLLMSAPLMSSDVNITLTGDIVSKSYIDMTLAMMARFGIDVVNKDSVYTIAKNQHYQSPKSFHVEGDMSTASYFLAAAAIRGGEVEVHGVGKHSLQGELSFMYALEKMGASIQIKEQSIICKRNNLVGIDIDANDFPDTAMTLAVVALFAQDETIIRNIYNWRLKETDRLTAMATELKKVGAKVEEGSDFIRIEPPQVFQYATIHTYNDHRMAMCFSLLSFSPEGIGIDDPMCVSKTCPGFFSWFKQLHR